MIIKTIFVSLVLFSISFAQEHIGIHQYEWEYFSSKIKSMDVVLQNADDIIPLQQNNSRDLTATVFGYLPDWEYLNGNAQYLKYDLLTHIACFDFTVSKNGSVSDPASWPWTDLINKAHEAGTKVILTAVNFNRDDIRYLITNEEAKNNFFQNVKNKIQLYKMDGVNVDFEGLYTDDRGSKINSFMSELTSYIHRELPGKEVSFAGPAVNWSNHWDLEGLAESCDYIFIMGYAFWGSWSSTSGPNAPLEGFSKDITNTVTVQYQAPLSKYPEKLILGVPYYGLEWITSNRDPYSDVVDYVHSSRFRTDQPQSQQYGRIWDTRSKTPWYRWESNGIHQIWYDDSISLAEKYDLAIQHNMQGVGMWALGYDGDRVELWGLIENKFMVPTSASDENLIIDDYKLFQNYPNPFNPNTVITYQLPVNSKVKITVYNVLGLEIALLVNDYKSAGKHKVNFNATNLTSGIFFYTLQINNVIYKTKKMVVLK